MIDYRKEIDEISMALTVARKSGVRQSVELKRYLNVMRRRLAWSHKMILAQSKIAYYESVAQRYAKKLGRHVG